MERFSDLKCKEVINVFDGSRLGHVYDLIFDRANGEITAIIVPGCGKLISLIKGGDDIIIPWKRIAKIGEDVILVECERAALRNGQHF